MTQSEKPIPHHMQDFLDWLEIEEGLSSKSQENYARFLKKFLNWLSLEKLGSLKPHELTPDHIWQYRVYLSRHCLTKLNQPLKKSTQNYYLIALRSMLNYFAHRDIVALPSTKIQLAKDKKDREVRFLNLEQLEKLFSAPNLKTSQGLRDRAILEVFFSTGMRISELVALNRDQIKIKPGMTDFELSIIGKGGKARTIYFSDRALFALDAYLKSRQDNERAVFIHYRARQGSPKRLTPRSIEKKMKQYCIATGLPLNTTPHVMRHSFATDLLNQGVDLRMIQEFLGHKNIAATQIYAHVTSQKLREVHKKLHSGRKFKS